MTIPWAAVKAVHPEAVIPAVPGAGPPRVTEPEERSPVTHLSCAGGIRSRYQAKKDKVSCLRAERLCMKSKAGCTLPVVLPHNILFKESARAKVS